MMYRILYFVSGEEYEVFTDSMEEAEEIIKAINEWKYALLGRVTIIGNTLLLQGLFKERGIR